LKFDMGLSRSFSQGQVKTRMHSRGFVLSISALILL